MPNRDDFSKKTVAELAKRVAWVCSNPHCRTVTIGAKPDGEGVIIKGTAAHITAAAPRGPRYNPSLSQAERKDISNGIWLCNNCATIIDRDSKTFTTSLLYEWKREAEEQSFAALVGIKRNILLARKIPVELDETDREMIRNLGFPQDHDIERVTAELRAAAQLDIEAFKREKNWPQHPVSLTMTYKGSCGTHKWSHENLAAALEVASEVSIIADPGTGKTTAMVQVAEDILNSGGGVAVVIPLAEWSSRPETLFQSLTHRNAFRNYKEQHFMLLACYGRLLLLLDGWNELDSTSRSRFLANIKLLRRDFPLIRIALSARRQARNLPISGPIIEIEKLSEEQQIEIACALRGDDGTVLLEEARRTDGVRELVSIPLYLNSLLASTTCGKIPTNKEAVLRLFVTEHEKVPDRAEALNQVVLGCHSDILIGLAVEAMNSNNTTIKDSRARTVVNDIESSLVKDGQITNRPEPLHVINALVEQHLLVRDGSDGGLSFQHQQFQEWYASFKVESLMIKSSAGDTEALRDLRTKVLNVPFWEEAILFACERLSVGDADAVRAVGQAILQCTGIDPMLSAEMIYRSSPNVWDAIKADILSFVARWHKPGEIDRGLGFMITTGKPDFSMQVCPLVLHVDSQVHLEAIRAARQFRTGVLGDNIKAQISALPEETRESIMTAIVMNSGIDGVQLAADVAKTETSANVQAAIIMYLIIQDAGRFAAAILRNAPQDVWKMVACDGFVDDIADVEITERLQQEYQSYIAGVADPLKKLKLILEHGNMPEAGRQVEEIITSNDYPVKDQNAYWTLMDAKARYSPEVINAMLRRIEAGYPIPYGSKTLLFDAPPIEDGPIAELVTDTEQKNYLADVAVFVVGAKVVCKLINKLLKLSEQINLDRGRIEKATIEEHHLLIRRICNSNPNAFLSVIELFGDTRDPNHIALLADLLDRYGQNDETRINEDYSLSNPLEQIILQWIEVLLSVPSADRYHNSELVRVIRRFPRPEFFDGLRCLLVKELELAKQSEQRHIVYTNLYRDAFAAIGGERVSELMIGYLTDPQFGIEAAYTLKDIWDKENGNGRNFLKESPNFSRAAELYRRRNTDGMISTSTFADEIFAAVNDMLRPVSGEPNYHHILKLACAALGMPHDDKTPILAELLALPVPLSQKHHLLTSLVAAGYEIDSDMIIQGLHSLLDEAKEKPWLLDEHVNRIDDWLMLMPFSDNPEALHEAFESSKAYLKDFWQIRPLLSALAHAPTTQSEAALFKLAEDDQRLYGEYEWLDVIVHRGTVSAALKLVEVICDGKLIENQGRGLDNWSLARRTAPLFECHTEARGELILRYDSAPNVIKDQIEHILAEIVNEDWLLVLIRRYEKDGLHYDRRLEEVARSTALGRKKIEQNMLRLYRIDVSNLRKKLLLIVNAGGPASDLATACLITIDMIRDEYGCLDSELRHPDIESGRPWPLEA
jgi:hypothetical protein